MRIKQLIFVEVKDTEYSSWGRKKTARRFPKETTRAQEGGSGCSRFDGTEREFEHARLEGIALRFHSGKLFEGRRNPHEADRVPTVRVHALEHELTARESQGAVQHVDATAHHLGAEFVSPNVLAFERDRSINPFPREDDLQRR